VSHPTDDGFHEIQLNGKQLVFLFMAVTVVSVAIFLSGVLVGRGVRAEQASRADQAAAAAVDLSGPRSVAVNTPPPASADPTTAAPPTPVDDLSYFKRLEQPNQPADDLKPIPKSAAKPSSTPPSASTSSAKNAKAKDAAAKDGALNPTPPTPAADASAVSPAPGSGFAVQIAAVNVRGDADAMAKRLSAKGYSAYVLPSTTGGSSMFRVRVGTFKTRREANEVAARLQKEERLKVTPWVTP